MAEILLFRPKAELDAAENLLGFVDSCRNDLTIFGRDLPFADNTWDITEALDIKGMGNKRNRLIFSTLATAKQKATASMAEPFLSFAKAYLRYMHGFRPTKSVVFRMTALRALETALTESGGKPDPVRTDAGILNRAAQLIVEHYTEGVAYRCGGQLEMIASFLAENKLTAIPVRWRQHIKRPEDTARVGKKFDERRQSKMPPQSALDALPKTFQLAIEPIDVITSSVAALLCASPDRINEVLLLPKDCEVHQKYGKDRKQAYGLRWWPSKGAAPMVKWIVPSMSSVVQEALKKIRTATKQARYVSEWYEAHPNAIYLEKHLEELRSNQWLSIAELGEVLGLSRNGSPRAWCKTNLIKVHGGRRNQKVRFAEVQDTVISKLPKGFPILNLDTGLKYSEALLIVRTNELHPTRGTLRCLIEPITIGQINSGLGGRVSHGFGSVFSRLGFSEDDGSPIKVTTHQFRHYLNTLAQAGGMSQLDIAKWSGRKDIQQNAAYDHVTPDQMLQKIRSAVGDESQMFGPLTDLPKRTLIPRNEFAQLIIPTAHTTDLGFCIHDYTMSPCQRHMDCIHCEDLICVKGNEERAKRLRLRLEEARQLQSKALQANSDRNAGSDRWLTHHNSTVERLDQLCSIMDDPNVPPGSVVQLAPLQSTQQINGEAVPCVPPPDVPSGTVGLLTDLMTSMGD